MKPTEPQWILANHYLSMIYGIFGELRFRAINLNYAGIARVVEKLALGLPLRGDIAGAQKNLPMEKRMAAHIAFVLSARARKLMGMEPIFLKRATEFIEKHKQLFAEITLTGNYMVKEPVDTGARV